MGKGIWVGVDLGKKEFVAAVAVDVEQADKHAGRRLPREAFAHAPAGVQAFVVWLRACCGGRELRGIVVESTGRLSAQWVALLGEGVGPVAVINPRWAKDFGRSLGLRDKTDVIDAQVLALYGAAVGPAPTPRLSPVRQRLRDLNRLFTALSTDRQAYAQRLGEYAHDPSLAAEARKMIAALERRMRSVQKKMDALIEGEPGLAQDVERIVSIAGMGRRTAYVLLAELGDLRSYSRRELTAYVGLYPRQVQSGTSVRKRPRMARGGGAAVRRMLYLCAMSARKHNPQLKRYFEHLVARGKHKMSALGTLMRKLLLMARSILKGNTFYDPNHA